MKKPGLIWQLCLCLPLLLVSSGLSSPSKLAPRPSSLPSFAALSSFTTLPGIFLDKTHPQASIAAVERMPRLPSPLAVRDWRDVSQRYYNWVLDPAASGGSFPVVSLETGQPGFTMKDYVGGQSADEALACLSAVVGAKLVGLDPKHLHGINYVKKATAWYNPVLGVYCNRPGDTSAIMNADIYGYWAAILGMEMAAQYPDDKQLQRQTVTSAELFLKLAHGLGAPEHPNYDVLGWDFSSNAPGGRPEPMNRLGNAPSVAWILMVGASLTGDPEMLRCARATMQWYLDHPGRYEITQAMGPLTAARLNASGGKPLNMNAALNAWFGDGNSRMMPWQVTAGTHFGSMTEDGLDAAKWPNGEFYAFTMGTLQNPAWLLPVARYDPRYARTIARFALNAANSARLLEGEGLDADHQDHAAWKAKWDKGNLLFYEGLMSSAPGAHSLCPYATGDPVLNGWNTGHPRIDPQQYIAQRPLWFGDTADDLGLYGGNHVGFLGGIVSLTKEPGILRWNCLATDWFHPAALPTFLYYNPYPVAKSVLLTLPRMVSLYDAVAGRFIVQHARPGYRLILAPDQAVVLVQVPSKAKLVQHGTKLLANGIVINYHVGRTM